MTVKELIKSLAECNGDERDVILVVDGTTYYVDSVHQWEGDEHSPVELIVSP